MSPDLPPQEPPAENSPTSDARATPADDVTQPAPVRAASGAMIGPYQLLQMVGEGGMGEVWLAEQKHPVRRRVALKLVKAGMDTRQVVARFQSERQAIALMDHPAIAKVFEAGSTPEGRPYFVMEYVAGVPITTYCDTHKLTMRERLELFVQVCGGVQHAHQKAIIHRDLKPSNILITEVDGKPMPKIIDFGIAKATSQNLTAETMFTLVGTIMGTPEYMSPEQSGSTGEDVDTRTDGYSLGVVLYELLVGALPLDLKQMRKLALHELLRRGKLSEAERLQWQILEIGRRVLDPEHPDTLMIAGNLANTLQNERRFQEAEKLQREVLDARRKVLGPDNPDTLFGLNNLASVLAQAARPKDAENCTSKRSAENDECWGRITRRLATFYRTWRLLRPCKDATRRR
jgi:serine/threonine protein kinase